MDNRFCVKCQQKNNEAIKNYLFRCGLPIENHRQHPAIYLVRDRRSGQPIKVDTCDNVAEDLLRPTHQINTNKRSVEIVLWFDDPIRQATEMRFIAASLAQELGINWTGNTRLTTAICRDLVDPNINLLNCYSQEQFSLIADRPISLWQRIKNKFKHKHSQ